MSDNRPDRPDATTPEGDFSDPFTVFDPARFEPDLRAMTRIVLRPIGSPLPLGFFTVAIDSTLVSALQWGILSPADRQAVALIVFPAFVVQLVVAVLAFMGRDSIAGTLMLSFATTWLVDALVFYRNPPGARAALGIFLVVFAVFAVFMLYVAFPKRAMAAVLMVTVPRFLVAGIAEISGSDSLAKVAAVLGFLLTAVSLYTAFALLLEDTRGEEILPIGRSGPAYHAVHGNLALQLRNLERQAGVRRTL